MLSPLPFTELAVSDGLCCGTVRTERRHSSIRCKQMSGAGFASTMRSVPYGRLWRTFCPPSAEVAIGRVAERVRQSGHSVPENVVRRRFDAGHRNFERIYRPLVDAWALFDNAGTEPVLIDWGENP